MTNGSFSNSISKFIDKHGVVALVAIFCAWGFYEYTLKPIPAEKTMILEMFQENIKSNQEATREIAKNTTKMAENMHLQRQTLEHLKESSTEERKINAERNRTLVAFTKTVLKDHPEQHKKLDILLKNLPGGETRIHRPREEQ